MHSAGVSRNVILYISHRMARIGKKASNTTSRFQKFFGWTWKELVDVGEGHMITMTTVKLRLCRL